MEIAVLSDIHGNGIALNYVIEDIKKQNINKIIILGDVVMKGPMPMESFEALEKFDILAWVKGNTELWLEGVDAEELYPYYMYAKQNMSKESIDFLNHLPLEHSLNYSGFKILCIHGTPESIVEAIDGTVPLADIKEIIKDVEEDIILCGHSHCSFIGEVEGKKIFNVGSIGNPLDGDSRASYGILNFSDGEVELVNRRVSYPVNEILDVGIKNGFPKIKEYEYVLKSDGK